MQLSARNQIPGRVTNVHLGEVMAEISIDIGGGTTIVSAITRDSAERMQLTNGDAVVAIVKSTEVLVGKA